MSGFASPGPDTRPRQGFLAVRTLDVIIVNTLRDDAMRLAAWKTARRLDRAAKASTDTASAEPAAAEATPVTGDPLRRAS